MCAAAMFKDVASDVGGNRVAVVGTDFRSFCSRGRDQLVSQTDQMVADIDRRPEAVRAVQGFAAVAEQVVVFDVVVNQRCFVKRFD